MKTDVLYHVYDVSSGLKFRITDKPIDLKTVALIFDDVKSLEAKGYRIIPVIKEETIQ